MIENEDEERRGTDIPRESGEGRMLNAVEVGQSPQFIVWVDIDIFEAWLLKELMLIFGCELGVYTCLLVLDINVSMPDIPKVSQEGRPKQNWMWKYLLMYVSEGL